MLRSFLSFCLIFLFVPKLAAQISIANFDATTASSNPSMLLQADAYFYFVATIRDKNLLCKTEQLTRKTSVIDSTQDTAHDFHIVSYSDSTIYYWFHESYPFASDSFFLKQDGLRLLSGQSYQLEQLTMLNGKLFSADLLYPSSTQKQYLIQFINGQFQKVDSLNEISHLFAFRNELYVIGKDVTKPNWMLYKWEENSQTLLPQFSFDGCATTYSYVKFHIKNYKNETLFISSDWLDKMWQSDGASTTLSTLIHPFQAIFKEADNTLYIVDNITLKKWNATTQDFESMYQLCCIEADYGILKGVVYGTAASADTMNYEFVKIDASGHYPLLNIAKGEAASHPRYFVSDDNKLYFTAYHPDYGREVWETDGTVLGTKMTRDIFIQNTSNDAITAPQHLQIVKGQLFCSAYQEEVGRELFAINKSTQQLSLYQDINQDGKNNIILQIIATNEAIFTFTQTGIPDSSVNIWLTKDGITTLLKERVSLAPYSQTTLSKQSDFPVINHHIFWVQDKTQLWTSDGTEQGTHWLKTLNSIDFEMLTNGTTLYIVDGSNIWKSTPDLANFTLIPSNNQKKHHLSFLENKLTWRSTYDYPHETVYIENEQESGISDSIPLVGISIHTISNDSCQYLIFSNPPSGGSGGMSTYYQLYKYNQQDGLKRLKYMGAYFDCAAMVSLNKRGYFAVRGSKVEIWTSDGTATGTKKIFAASNYSDRVGLFQLIGQNLVFSVENENGVWCYNKDTDTITRILSMNPDITNNHSPSVSIHDKLYFAGKNANGESAIWRTDGTVQGTIPVSNAVNFVTNRTKTQVAQWNTHCYELLFPATNTEGVRGLWKWDYDFWANPQFSSFQIDTLGESLRLTWGMSASDYPAKLYEIQRNEGNGWQTLKTIPYLSTQPTYSFTDTVSIYGNTVYDYRVHAVSKYSCNEQYSEIVSFESLPKAIQDATEGILFPNPASAQLTLYLPQKPQTPVVVTIYNLLGEICQSFTTTNQRNVGDVSTLSSGIYLLSYQWEGKKQFIKFIKE